MTWSNSRPAGHRELCPTDRIRSGHERGQGRHQRMAADTGKARGLLERGRCCRVGGILLEPQQEELWEPRAEWWKGGKGREASAISTRGCRRARRSSTPNCSFGRTGTQSGGRAGGSTSPGNWQPVLRGNIQWSRGNSPTGEQRNKLVRLTS